MKTVGIIAEYNPFHNGHEYQIKEAKRITGADSAIIVMSGDFVQRGNPAIMPKHLRAECALQSGADLVIELPCVYATGSAEFFAKGAIRLLDSLHCVDSICFGSECDDIDALQTIARILFEEPDLYCKVLLQNLKEGMTYPHASQKALETFLTESKQESLAKALDSIISRPNNLLGIEYLKALLHYGSVIKPYTIKRMESCYHNQKLSETFSSATAVRNNIDNLEELERAIPAASLSLFRQQYHNQFPIINNDFSLILKTKLLSETQKSLSEYLDVNDEIANRILNQRNQFLTFDQYADLIKTRDITHSRVTRCLIHILLGIKEFDIKNETSSPYPISYYRVLGFKSESSDLLSIIKQRADYPIITSPSKAKDLISGNAYRTFSLDLYASDLYQSVVTDKYQAPFKNELSKSIVKV